MGRIVALIVCMAGLPAAAAGAQTLSHEGQPQRHRFELPELQGGYEESRRTRGGMIAGIDVAPNARIGLGMFGSKAKARDFPGSEVLGGPKPRKRKAGVGVTLKF